MRPHPMLRPLVIAALLLALLAAASCGEDFSRDSLGTQINHEPVRPGFGGADRVVTPYTGDDPYVLEAQRELPTAIELHRKVIWRTCTPNGGVCHNRKEYPDLHTPSNFLNAIGAPCNVQSGEPEGVFDRCEQLGDRFKLGDDNLGNREIEIGYIDYIPGEYVNYRDQEAPPDAASPGLHLYLHEPLSTDRDEVYASGQFIRTFIVDGDVSDIVFARFDTRWWILDDGEHLLAEVRDYQLDQVNELLSIGVLQGDLNRNGVFGHRDGRAVPLINPGDPETSYLVARLRGEMEGEHVPGSRMPLANPPLTISEMLALFCFIEGLALVEQIDADLAWPIDYANCSYSRDAENLNLLGEAGASWEGRVKKLLEANCGGCHSGSDPVAGLDVLSDGLHERLFQPSSQVPEMPLIDPGAPENSYLWLKLNNDERILGSPMPYNPLTGEGGLPPSALNDIEQWILDGALATE